MATNQQRLLSVVQAHAPGQPFLEEFKHFNLSVKQKLWSVDYFCGQIEELEPKVLFQQQQIRESTVVLKKPIIDREGFGLYANLVLDGFLMNAMATLDTLAHEIKILYTFQPPLQDVYIKTIKNKLRRQHPHCNLTKYLSNELAKPWFDSFSKYRHCTTHESLVGSNVNYGEALITGELRQASITLPDDPRNRPLTYDRKIELKSYCAKVKRNIYDLVRHSYYCIIRDIQSAGGALPIV